MGQGKRLKEILEKHNTNVRKIAKEANLKASTLYSIIQKDTELRLEYAIQIAKVLGIEPMEFYEYEGSLELPGSSTQGEEIYEKLKEMSSDEIAALDLLLRSYYQLVDKGRKAFMNYIKFMLEQQKES